MKKLVLASVLCASNLFASECDFKNFDIYKLIGVFENPAYICEENLERGSSCYTVNDSYRKVTEMSVSPFPTGVDVGIEIELFDKRGDVVLTQTFSNRLHDRRNEFSCVDQVIDGIKITEIIDSMDFGDFKSSMRLTRKGDIVEFEIKSVNGSESSRYLFTQSNP